ncbi:MAG: hypothetical protein KDN19_20245 [Verrucomicrobiae bacterium]|nr:hypothetical protein [Verrucomicrobiae bacterium]
MAWLLTGAALDSAHSQDFETPPIRQASELLDQAWLQSAVHSVEPEVTADTMLYRFVVHSEYGNFEVYGIDFLKMRVKEIQAAATLDKKLLAGSAAKGVVTEGVDSAKTIAGAARNPVQTVFNIPKGIAAFGKRAVTSTENKVKESGNYEGGAITDWFQVSEEKLKLASKLQVDPYTDNEELSKQLSRKSGSSALGGISLRLLVPGDGLITAADEGKAAEKIEDAYLTPPTKLFEQNRKMLLEMGVSEERASAFLANTVHSPADQALIIRAAKGIEGLEKVETLLDAADMTANRVQTIYFRRNVEILRHRSDQGNPIKRFANFRGYPVGITADGTLMLPAYLDFAYWGQRGPVFVKDIKDFAKEQGAGTVEILLTGAISEKANEKLTAAGIKVVKL